MLSPTPPKSAKVKLRRFATFITVLTAAVAVVIVAAAAVAFAIG